MWCIPACLKCQLGASATALKIWGADRKPNGSMGSTYSSSLLGEGGPGGGLGLAGRPTQYPPSRAMFQHPGVLPLMPRPRK